MFKKIFRFLKFNEHKLLTIQAYFYSAIYKYEVFHIESQKLHAKWGKEGEDSTRTLSIEQYRYARKVSYCVNQVCNKTAWESKCLVRALTARKLLSNKKIPSTLYLGCGKNEDGTMNAHAWLRSGECFVTGGNGEGHAIVSRFSSQWR